MLILNMTPDSFSDGGMHAPVDASAVATRTMSALRSAGAHILDIGGQSTRPGAEDVGADEELSRILPTIRAIRHAPGGNDICISVDTFRAHVAAEAIAAGADFINDVSAGAMDDEMLPTVARLGVTVCLMHMRGTPSTMNGLAAYPDGVVPTVARELARRVQAAEEAGIPRWRMVLDPGIGFAKTQTQNLELLRSFSDLRDFEDLRGLPWLVGPSRKAFIGRITGVSDARDRVWGTATAVSAAVAGGADIVRVHDASEMTQVVRMADAIWRN